MNLVQDYNPEWPSWFEEIRLFIGRQLEGIQYSIEHVGSTSIPRMVAKPVIDIDIVIDQNDIQVVKEQLAKIRYSHQGDLGFPGRDAFDLTHELKANLPDHHLYVCRRESPELRKHLAFREFMRLHPEWIRKLSDLKHSLCVEHQSKRKAYMDGKSKMVQEITELALSNFSPVRIRTHSTEKNGGA